MGAVADLLAVDVDPHERRSRDLLPAVAVGIDEKAAGLAGRSNRRMRIDEVGHLIVGQQTIAGRQLYALPPFGGLLLDGQGGDRHWTLLSSSRL
jgi:hypothetical protein